MTEHRNVAVVDTFEATTRHRARLRKGMVGRMQARAMAILKAGRKPDGHGMHILYINATLNGSEKGKGNVNTKLRTFAPFVSERGRVSFK